MDSVRRARRPRIVTHRSFVARKAWLVEEGLRLDAAAYAVGGIEARELIRKGPWRVEPLVEVAQLFNESRFARTYVTDATRGVPYLTGTDMLSADLVDLLLLSKARTARLPKLVVREGWTLISCSGTIGRSVFVRRSMDGMALSHDVIRAIPRPGMPPGFLFAFLSSAPAQSMIRQKTYGSVVQHIEPHHLSDLPLPVPTSGLASRIHGLVMSAANARTDAADLLRGVTDWFDGQGGSRRHPRQHGRAVSVVSRAELRSRLDAFHHIGWAGEVADVEGPSLGSLADVFAVSSMPRVWAERGVPFVTGSNIFAVRPEPERRLATWAARQVGASVQTGDLLVQAYGQLYGLIGRAAYVGHRAQGWAASHLLFRVRAETADTRAWLFAFFLSDVGRRQVVGRASGNQIPHLVPAAIRSVRVPELPADLIAHARRAIELREEADAKEEQAIVEVEQWLAS